MNTNTPECPACGGGHAHTPANCSVALRAQPTEITFESQLEQARRLLAEKGIDALHNPHAATGRLCGCGSCFCCAAFQVYVENRDN